MTKFSATRCILTPPLAQKTSKAAWRRRHSKASATMGSRSRNGNKHHKARHTTALWNHTLSLAFNMDARVSAVQIGGAGRRDSQQRLTARRTHLRCSPAHRGDDASRRVQRKRRCSQADAKNPARNVSWLFGHSSLEIGTQLCPQHRGRNHDRQPSRGDQSRIPSSRRSQLTPCRWTHALARSQSRGNAMDRAQRTRNAHALRHREKRVSTQGERTAAGIHRPRIPAKGILW